MCPGTQEATNPTNSFGYAYRHARTSDDHEHRARTLNTIRESVPGMASLKAIHTTRGLPLDHSPVSWFPCRASFFRPVSPLSSVGIRPAEWNAPGQLQHDLGGVRFKNAGFQYTFRRMLVLLFVDSWGHTGGGQHICFVFAPSSSCGACLHLFREKGPAVPFSRQQ